MLGRCRGNVNEQEKKHQRADSLMEAGDPHGAHLHVPAFFFVAERLHSASNPLAGLDYGHLVDDDIVFPAGNAAVKVRNFKMLLLYARRPPGTLPPSALRFPRR